MSYYKYAKVNKYTIENLKSNHLFMQIPRKFNDPYEFVFKFNVNDEIYIDFLKLIYGVNYLDFIKKKLTKEEVLSYTRNYYFGESWDKLGVACLTENENNDIMWAHYGDNHRGICIEFDDKKHPFNLFEKVKYVNSIMDIKIDTLQNFENNIPEIFNDVYIRKNFIWSYENEWRLISTGNSFVEYMPNAIKSITFGFYCNEENRNYIYEATSNLKIKYFDVVRSIDSYRIEKKLVKVNGIN